MNYKNYYQDLFCEDNTMANTREQYCLKIYNIWTRYKRKESPGLDIVLESMICMDPALKRMLDYYSNAFRDLCNRRNDTYINVNFTTDMCYPIISYWSLQTGHIKDWLPYIREDYDIKEEHKRLNRIYCIMYDDLHEHLENNDAFDLELAFEYPYPAVNDKITETVDPFSILSGEVIERNRQEPIDTTWAEYLANNNLRSVGGQNE